MANQGEVVRGLAEASQKHEKEIVIDFASDRILHYIGVYLVAFLAVIAKVSELAGANLSCYPFGNTSMRADFIAYATTYCWETSKVTNSVENIESTCANTTVSGRALLKNPSLFKGLIQWIPYVMIFEAILFSVPSVFWHYSAGARLMGHLKFMQQILGDMYDKVKVLETARYRTGESYDKKSYYLDGGRGFKPEYWKSDDLKDSEKDKNQDPIAGSGNGNSRNAESGNGNPPDIESGNGNSHDAESGNGNPPDGERGNGNLPDVESGNGNPPDVESGNGNPPDNKSGNGNKGCLASLVGEMRDRHLFSMLCFENFSNLEHIPYILSMYILSQTKETMEDSADTMPRIKGILRLICHKDNFCERFLVKRYIIKHMFGSFVAITMLIATTTLIYMLGAEGWNAENFRCDMVYHMNVCMVCTIRRKRDMNAYLVANLLVNFFYLALSLIQWWTIRMSSVEKSTSYFFEEISVFGSGALNKFDKTLGKPYTGDDESVGGDGDDS